MYNAGLQDNRLALLQKAVLCVSVVSIHIILVKSYHETHYKIFDERIGEGQQIMVLYAGMH